MISPALVTRTSSLPRSAELELAAADELLEDDVVVELEGGGDGVADRGESVALATPMEEPRLAGLTKRGRPSAASPRRGGRATSGACGEAPGGDGEAVVVEDRLGDALVHADGRGEHAGADVGDAERLEVALDDAVLAEGAVQDGEDDDGVRCRVREAVVERRRARRRGSREEVVGGRQRVGVVVDAMSTRTPRASTHCLSWVRPIAVTDQPRPTPFARCGAPRCTRSRARRTGPRRRPPVRRWPGSGIDRGYTIARRGRCVRFSTSELAARLGAALVGPDVTVDGASIDSRSLLPDSSSCRSWRRGTGTTSSPAALAAGAPAYLTAEGPVAARTAVVVRGDRRGAAGAGRRGALAGIGPGGVVGITGSVGKTTTKDLVRACLATAFPTAASERSFNNELGLPLTLLNAADDAQWVVLEMGARGVGHIARLAEVARPDVGVVTSVAMAHIEFFGDLDGVARAKSELVAALPDSGVAVLNFDDPRVAAMAVAVPRPGARVFGRRRRPRRRCAPRA